MRQILLIGLVAPFFMAACGPTCQSTCQKLYSESECNIKRPDMEQSELIRDCLNYCEDALDTPGDLGNYDPFNTEGSSRSKVLENENQAASWMYCVSEIACDDLGGGANKCPPVW